MGVFSPSGPGVVSSSTPDLVLSSPSISRQTLPATANTEDSIVFSSSVKFFRIRAQGTAKLLISYTVSGSATGWTIAPGFIYQPPAILNLSGTLTLYLQANKSSAIVEIETWS